MCVFTRAVTRERVLKPLRECLGSFILPGLSLISESKYRLERDPKKGGGGGDDVTHVKVLVDYKAVLVLIFSHEDDTYRRHVHRMKFKIKLQWKSKASIKKS